MDLRQEINNQKEVEDILKTILDCKDLNKWKDKDFFDSIITLMMVFSEEVFNDLKNNLLEQMEKLLVNKIYI